MDCEKSPTTVMLPVLYQELDYGVLDGIGILVFIEKNVLEQILVGGSNLRLSFQQVEGMEQDIVKVHCVRLFEPLVVMLEDEVELSEFFDGMDVGIRFEGILGPADMGPYRSGVLAFHIETVFQNIFDEPDLIGSIVNGDRVFEADLSCMRFQYLQHRGMKCPYPGKIFDPSSGRFCEPIF